VIVKNHPEVRGVEDSGSYIGEMATVKGNNPRRRILAGFNLLEIVPAALVHAESSSKRGWREPFLFTDMAR